MKHSFNRPMIQGLAAPHNPPGSPVADDSKRLTGVLRSLLIRR